jgi:hypothetical protein
MMALVLKQVRKGTLLVIQNINLITTVITVAKTHTHLSNH